ncbi:MAG: hypothetical protein KUG71_09950 [Porticoccaceae bacterium]|nr:hypothetical protein [Porticoccaceae bacterium]
METKIVFGGLISGYRVVVINDITFHIPEEQIKNMMLEGVSNTPNSHLSNMSHMDCLCGTLVPHGYIKFALTTADFQEAKTEYKKRLDY